MVMIAEAARFCRREFGKNTNVNNNFKYTYGYNGGVIDGNDTLTDNIGCDEIFYAMGSGIDVVNLFGISLNKITYASITDSEIIAGFSDGGQLNVKSSAAVGFKVEGVTHFTNRSNGRGCWIIEKVIK